MEGKLQVPGAIGNNTGDGNSGNAVKFHAGKTCSVNAAQAW
ncbi:MAG TPA: hypothetical protein VMJ12_16185 [Candidatus Acidoferrales bacterium]|nr:hypothetical protein [Candidatus Acidoferrales bacterium]